MYGTKSFPLFISLISILNKSFLLKYGLFILFSMGIGGFINGLLISGYFGGKGTILYLDFNNLSLTNLFTFFFFFKHLKNINIEFITETN